MEIILIISSLVLTLFMAYLYVAANLEKFLSLVSNFPDLWISKHISSLLRLFGLNVGEDSINILSVEDGAASKSQNSEVQRGGLFIRKSTTMILILHKKEIKTARVLTRMPEMIYIFGSIFAVLLIAQFVGYSVEPSAPGGIFIFFNFVALIISIILNYLSATLRPLDRAAPAA
jgi:hypothetical protein